MTFSIVAIDPESREIGSAVASRSTAVGGTVCYSRVGVGVVNTQHYADLALGERVLDRMERGVEPQLALDAVLGGDPSHAARQLIAIDHRNRRGAFTGEACAEHCRHRIGEHCVAAGNMLADARAVERMVEVFEGSKGSLGGRLLRCLEAAEEAGGDRRGRQSAAVKVVPPREALTDVNLDLRVDDHPDPLRELRRLYDVFRAEFGP